MKKLDKLKNMKNNGNKDSVPTDMHADGVHFDDKILVAKRTESARSEDESTDVDETLKQESHDNDQRDKKDKDSKKPKEEIIKDMDGGYNRDAPIKD